MAKSPMTWRMASESPAIRERPGLWGPGACCLCVDRRAFGVSVAGLCCRCHVCGDGCGFCGEWMVGPPDRGLPGACRSGEADAAGCCEAGVMSGERDRAGMVPAKRQVRRSCRPGPADTPVEKTVVRPAGRDVVLFDRAGESGEFGGRVVPRAGPWGFGGYLLMLTRSPRRESEAEMMRELAWKPR